MAGSLRKPAKSGFCHSSCLRTNVCGDVHAESIVFLSFRTGPKRLPRPASWGSPPPKAVPALGIHPSSGSTSFFFLKRCPMGHNAVSFQDYRGQFHVRKLKTQAIRSTPRIQSFSLGFRQQRCSEQVLDTSLMICIARLASTESNARTQSTYLFGVERAILIQSHSSWGRPC